MKKIMMAAALLCALESIAQKKEATSDSTATKSLPRTDSVSASKPKAYDKVITSKAVTKKGLLTVHQLDESYYLEIPDSLLGREILMVTRLAKSPVDGLTDASSGGYYAGDQIDEREITFEKGPAHKIFMRSISYRVRSTDSSDNGMYHSVRNSSLQPILAAFPVKTYNEKDPATVIDITDIVSSDNSIFALSAWTKTKFKTGALQRDRSYVKSVRPFSHNVEITTVKTYASSIDASGSALTFEINNSLVLLPRIPMTARLGDARVGFFATGYIDFDANPQGVKGTNMVTRWRLEPKDEDREKYFNGQLVEPKKPIVFYIDPATPKKWVPYLIQGVNDWQAAFEQAGFKNAIIAKEAPLDDSTWSLDDASHSAIVYKPSAIANASGPHVHDPRSGEILEAHINWYHNVMSLVHSWYMIQAGAIDPRARKMEFDDELMGQLIRFVSSHEVGHTLGLMHNFGSSSTVPVDSLRSKKWVEAHGHTPSIMDYARFNYVAQPEDSIGEKGIFPRINDYDKWAIEWGYRLFPGIKEPKDENTLLNKWVIDSLTHNHRLWYGPQSIFVAFDPRSQNEDLGDDAMKAGSYGIKNLKRILPLLPEWTRKPNDGYHDLEEMYKALLAQYARYAGHVAANIGGHYLESKSVEEKGELHMPVPAVRQERAIAWLNEEVFKTPSWLDYRPVTDKAEGFFTADGYTDIGTRTLGKLLSSITLSLLVTDAAKYGEKNVYACTALLADLKKGIWSELNTHRSIDAYRRALQDTYVETLAAMVKPAEKTEKERPEQTPEEILIVIKPHLTLLKSTILAALPATTDIASKAHLQLMAEKIANSLKPTK